MIYGFIKSILDDFGYKSAQDTPFSQTQDFADILFVYTNDGKAITTFNMGCPNMESQQNFKIYGITSDLFIENSMDDNIAKKLLEVFSAMKASLPQYFEDSNGTHQIIDIFNPTISYEGTDNKQLRVTSLSFSVIWTYRYGGN